MNENNERTGLATVLAPVTAPGRGGVKPIDEYLNYGEVELYERIGEAKRKLGDRVVVLGHHYQRDDVICHADLTGDSYKLAQMAARRAEAEFIVFCGVHFMAESADILSGHHQQVILPDLACGLFDGRYGSARAGRDCLGAAAGAGPRFTDADHLHELRGEHQGLLRAAGGRSLHFVKRGPAFRLGVKRAREAVFLSR